MKLREGNPNQTESPNYFDLFTLVCEVIMTWGYIGPYAGCVLGQISD
jgi:hypothetical protein